MPGPQAFSSRRDALQEAGIVLKLAIGQVLAGDETDQHADRTATTRDDDLLPRRIVEQATEVLSNRGQRNAPHSVSPNCSSHSLASDLATIARISTREPTIS